MSLKRNIAYYYASQIYVTAIGIALVPIYIRYLGLEGYGLVGIFSTVQAWFGLLDAGLTLTLIRETTRWRAQEVDTQTYTRFVYALELIFMTVAIAGGGMMFFGSAGFAQSWLNVGSLDIATVTNALKLMSIAVAARWVSGLYRGVVAGAENFAGLGAFNAAVATVRFVGVIPALLVLGSTPEVFFGFQCAVAVLELGSLVCLVHVLTPALSWSARKQLSLETAFTSLRGPLTFSISLSVAALAWAVMTQIDKLLLSRLIPLAEFGLFSVAALAAGGVMLVAAPMMSVMQPRLASLHALGKHGELVDLYRKTTRVVVALVAPVCLAMAIFPQQVLFAWTGSHAEFTNAAEILRMYAIGNGVLTVAAFPFYLQYAKGDLRLHLAGCCLFLLAFIPLLLTLVNRFGGSGAGYAWLAANLAYLAIWTPIVHGHFAKGIHKNWLVRDVLVPSLSSLTLAYIISETISATEAWPTGRGELAMVLIAIVGVVFAVSVLAQADLRHVLANWILKNLSRQAEP